MRDSPGWSGRITRALLGAIRWIGRLVRGEVVKRVGGPARARVIVLFAIVLALNGADTATIGAIAPQLESALHINNTDIGLLSSISLLVGAIFTIPVGLLVDRTKRMPILAFSIVLWSLASLFSAFAGSFGSLLLTRLALGAVAATAGPAIASLTGDYFSADERGRVWSYILVGEAAGSAVGFIVSGSVASLIGWRAAFIVLAAAFAGLLAWLFRTRPGDLTGPRAGGELALCLGAMVVVDPLAWKAHYVALITAYVFCWWALRKGGAPLWHWGLWWGSLVCLTGSAAAIWGGHVSHVFESYDVILAGAVMLLVLVGRQLSAISDQQPVLKRC